MNGNEAKVKLEEAIARNVGSAAQVARQVIETVPTDQIVRAQALTFFNKGTAEDGELTMYPGDEEELTLHPHALRQVGERASIPATYVDALMVGATWQKVMLTNILNKTFANAPIKQRHLVRSVNGKARGFLSDKYRRLDSRPVIDAFMQGVQGMGAVPYSGHASDIRCALKVILPRVITVGKQQEHVAVGIEFSNSDYGAGKLSIRSFILRLWCINGATAEDAMSQVHLGGRLNDDIEYSKKTYELDTRTTVSAVKDVVRATLDPKQVDSLLGRISAAQETTVDWKKLKAQLAGKLSKDEARRVDEAFTGPDVQNLPPGETVWRASNALSWVAQQVEGGDRRLELEKLAGAVALGALKEAA